MTDPEGTYVPITCECAPPAPNESGVKCKKCSRLIDYNRFKRERVDPVSTPGVISLDHSGWWSPYRMPDGQVVVARTNWPKGEEGSYPHPYRVVANIGGVLVEVMGLMRFEEAKRAAERLALRLREDSDKVLVDRETVEAASGALTEVLDSMWKNGHPGRPCLSTDWIAVERVAEWRGRSKALRAALTSSPGEESEAG